MFNTDYPKKPTDKAKIDSTQHNGELLGKNDLGTVHLHNHIGNIDSNVKIAYLIGMHPLESKSHRGIFDTLLNKSNDLNYSYTIYNIDVKNIDEKNEGRVDGQLLAQEFVAPHIINNNYSFFADIHSNKGPNGPGSYEITRFLFAPGFDDVSTKYMNQLLSMIPELEYYAPEYRTSPEYITVPVANSGIPTIVYETFSYEEMSETYSLSEKLVDTIDNLEFNDK